jgi:hypothetical protein
MPYFLAKAGIARIPTPFKGMASASWLPASRTTESKTANTADETSEGNDLRMDTERVMPPPHEDTGDYQQTI